MLTPVSRGCCACVQTQAGLPLVDGISRSKPTKRVHVYAPSWALQGEGYTAEVFRAAPVR